MTCRKAKRSQKTDERSNPVNRGWTDCQATRQIIDFSSDEIAKQSIVLGDGFTMLMTHDVTQDEVDHFFRDVDCKVGNPLEVA